MNTTINSYIISNLTRSTYSFCKTSPYFNDHIIAFINPSEFGKLRCTRIGSSQVFNPLLVSFNIGMSVIFPTILNAFIIDYPPSILTTIFITILLQWYSTNMSHIKQTTYLIYRSFFYAFYMRFSPLIRLKKHKLDQIESFGRIFVTQECEKSKSLI